MKRKNCREYCYCVITEGNRYTPVKYINDAWYQVYYNLDANLFYTQRSSHILKPEVLGLGTKQQPYLDPQDQKRIQGRDLSSSQDKAGPSSSSITAEDRDLPIGDEQDDSELATLVGAQMTTTTVAHA